MSVIGSSSSTSASSVQATTTTATNNAAGNIEDVINNFSFKLREVFQKLRNSLQYRNVQHSVNSFKLNKLGVEKQHEAANKTAEATKQTSIFAIAGGVAGGGLAFVPGLAKAGGKMFGGKSADQLAALKQRRQNTGMNEIHVEKLTKMDQEKTAQKIYNFGEGSKEYGLALSSVVPGLGNGLGGMMSAEPTREASRKKTEGDFILGSKSSYDKFGDNDDNFVRRLSQDCIEVDRLATNMYGGLMNSLTNK